MARRPFVAGNWKMNKTNAQALAYLDTFLTLAPSGAVDVAFAPPFTALVTVGDKLRTTRIALAAQTMHWADAGPYTGEIAPPMLRELGVAYAIVGHSERRAFCGETDSSVNRKVAAAHAHGITPIVAVGESAEEHAAGRAVERVVDQIRAAFAGIEDALVARSIVAYEPIWAIGSGTSDEPDKANATMGAIRSSLPALGDVRILYGGSMTPENCAAFMAQPNVDGSLVGGASLDPHRFAQLIANSAAW